LLAQRIKQIAAEAGVPLVENVPLARTLFKTVKIGQYVPRALYQAVAEVVAYVYRLRGRTR
jgi:flagellar biosynthetic protein FlhB